MPVIESFGARSSHQGPPVRTQCSYIALTNVKHSLHDARNGAKLRRVGRGASWLDLIGCQAPGEL